MKWWLPLLLFLGLFLLFAKNLLQEKKDDVPQINKLAPNFNLQNLQQTKFYNQNILQGKISLVNFWASWCSPCLQEHAVLIDIAEQYSINIIGINYKDESKNALKWLEELGNPYAIILTDAEGRAGIDWGVIAIPETFIVDSSGIVRYKHTGPITWHQWEEEIWPVIEKLS